MHSLHTRQQKIKFLSALSNGKASIKDLIEPVEGMVVIHNDEAVLYMSLKERIEFEPSISMTEFNERFKN